MGDVHGADDQDRPVPAEYGHAGDAVRATGGQRSTAGRRPAPWAAIASADGPADRSVPGRTRWLNRQRAGRSEGPGAALCRALVTDAARLGLTLSAHVRHEQDWCSATFTGTHLTVQVDARPHPAWTGILATWLAALPDRDLPMARHLVADLVAAPSTVIDAEITIQLEALLLDRPPTGT